MRFGAPGRYAPTVVATVGGLLTIVATVMCAAAPADGATTSWSAMSTPFIQPGSNQFLGVSCAPGTVKFCAAVGSTGPAQTAGPEGAQKTLAEVWNGKWRITPTPDPGEFNWLTQVSCASPTLCMAVGVLPSFLALWNGAAWSVLPDPVSGPSFFDQPSCRGTDCVVIVGQGSGAVGNLTESLELWNGQNWSDVTPTPLTSGSRLDEFSCFGVEQCAAIESTCGTQVGSCSNIGTWIFNEGVWTEYPPPNLPANGGIDTRALGCAISAGTDACMVFGAITNGVTTTGAFAEELNTSTGSWTTTAPPIASNAFSNVSCPTSSECVVAGATGNHPFAELWNGSVWTQMKASGTTTDQGFASVSCPLTTFCIAAENKPVFNDTQAVIDSWGTPPGGSSLLGGL